MEQEEMIDGKSVSRVHKAYRNDPKEFKAQLDMLLPDGITCKECRHCARCVLLFGQKEADTACQFYPSRYREILKTKIS